MFKLKINMEVVKNREEEGTSDLTLYENLLHPDENSRESHTDNDAAVGTGMSLLTTL